ncbi:MAG: cell division protein ZapA [Lautropia sp.]
MDQLEVKILERVFKLQVPAAERPRLMEAVRLVDNKMREIRDAGKASGLDRIAVNAALQLAYEFLGQERAPAVSSEVSNRISEMSEELELEIRRQESLF